MENTVYVVHTSRGRKRFDSIDAAIAYCSAVFERTGVVLGIVAGKR